MNNTKKHGMLDNGPNSGEEFPVQVVENWDGSMVPIQRNTDASVIIFVSLYCMTCVDLLPQLSDIIHKFSYSYTLITDGEKDDNREIADYFDWDFPIVQMSSSEMESKFGVTFTPFVIYADPLGVIAAKGIVNNGTDLEQLLSNSEK